MQGLRSVLIQLLIVPISILFYLFKFTKGKEVAKFAKNHYPKLVLEQLVANEGDVAMALRESFHRVDELLEDEVRFEQCARKQAVCCTLCPTLFRS